MPQPSPRSCFAFASGGVTLPWPRRNCCVQLSWNWGLFVITTTGWITAQHSHYSARISLSLNTTAQCRPEATHGPSGDQNKATASFVVCTPPRLGTIHARVELTEEIFRLSYRLWRLCAQGQKNVCSRHDCRSSVYKSYSLRQVLFREPVWPSGKALGW